MGVHLVVEQDEKGDYRVNPSPAVFVVHRGDSTAYKILPFFNGSSSPLEALKALDEDVRNKCRRGTPYIYGQCHLFVEDPSSEDLVVYDMGNGMPVDTGNRVRLAGAKLPAPTHGLRVSG